MNQRADEPTQSNGGIDSGAGRAPVGEHLGNDALNAFIDQAVFGAESSTIAAHLRSCASCRTSLAELQATRELLRSLPSPVPGRSFQLGPEHLRARSSVWDRFGAWLLPALPVLRAATVAVALLLAAVSIRNVLEDPASNGPAGDTAMIAQPVETVQSTAPAGGQDTSAIESNQSEAAPTAQSTSLPFAAPDETALTTVPPPGEAGGELVPAPEFAESANDAPADSDMAFQSEPSLEPESTMSGDSQPEDDRVLEESDQSESEAITGDEAGGDTTAQDSTSMRVDEGSGAASNAAPPGDGEPSTAMAVQPAQMASPLATPSPAPTATATSAPSPTATPTGVPLSPTPELTAEPERAATTESDRWDIWNIAQLLLATLLVLLLALIGLIALRRRHAVQ